jgi:chromosome segregation ATPase
VRLELATLKNEMAVIKSRDGDVVRALQDKLNESAQDWQSKWTDCREQLEDAEGSNTLLAAELKKSGGDLLDAQRDNSKLTVDLEQSRLAEEQWRGECNAATGAKNDLQAQCAALEAQKDENWASEQETVSSLRKEIILITSERDTNATSLRAASDQLRALQASLAEQRDSLAASSKAAEAKATELRGM